jgi:CBS domain-containing protein
VVVTDAVDASPEDDWPVTEQAAISWSPTDAQRRVSDAMHWGLISCAPDATLREVATLMSTEGVHCIVVTDEPSDSKCLWGVVFDDDLVAASTVRSLDDQYAGGTAMEPPVTALPYETLAEAARRMTAHGVSHLVVLDPAGDGPLGVLSTLDLARAFVAPYTSDP